MTNSRTANPPTPSRPRRSPLTIAIAVQHLPLKLSIFLIADYWYLFDLTLAVSFSVKTTDDSVRAYDLWGVDQHRYCLSVICRGLLY